jgi:hypothetical protein
MGLTWDQDIMIEAVRKNRGPLSAFLNEVLKTHAERMATVQGWSPNLFSLACANHRVSLINFLNDLKQAHHEREQHEPGASSDDGKRPGGGASATPGQGDQSAGGG